MQTKQGDIHWNELMTRDPAAARAFFEKTLGWTFIQDPMGPELPYLIAMNGGERPVCGIFEMDGPEFDGMPSHWMTYFAVDDVDAATAAVTAAGGKVMRPAFDVPQVGRIAIIADPTGGVAGIMTPAQGG